MEISSGRAASLFGSSPKLPSGGPPGAEPGACSARGPANVDLGGWGLRMFLPLRLARPVVANLLCVSRLITEGLRLGPTWKNFFRQEKRSSWICRSQLRGIIHRGMG